VRSLTALGTRIERLAKQQDGQSVSSQIAAILDGKASGPRLTDEEMARSAVGRRRLARRHRAEAGFQG
jgi:hypothetical protein